MAQINLCIIPGCSRIHEARGYCHSHYQQTLKHGYIKYPNLDGNNPKKISKRMKDNKIWVGRKHKIETIRKMKTYTSGITPLYKLIRDSTKYAEWRQKIFIRDSFICQKCGEKGMAIEAHHKKSFCKLIKEVQKYLPLMDLYEGAMIYIPLWDIDNGITLCIKCHNKTRKGRIKKDKSDWRDK